MRQMMILAAVLIALSIPVQGMEFTAPPAPSQVAQAVPEKADSFGEGLWNVLTYAMQRWNPSLHEAMGVCLRTAAMVLLCGIVRQIAPSMSGRTMELAETVGVSMALLEPSASLIQLGVQTVQELSEYGKLLFPVMTGALAAQGGITSSTALYTGTALFDSLISTGICKLIVPMIYLYLALSIANAALQIDLLGSMKAFLRWAMVWSLKLGLYLFTGYMAVTGVVSGSTDTAALKAAKITISGAVPVIGGILSDASEAVLVGAGVMRSAAGVNGVLTILALFAGPFIRLGVQYLLLKGLGALCGSLSPNASAKLVGDFSGVMGILLAMVSTQSVLLLISTVCFMKGVG